MKEFPKHYNFTENEKKWQNIWQELQIYAYDPNISKAEIYIVDTPPPTVSGQLHIGHIYSYTQTDFIVRFQRMIGKNIFYPIGFDDNGLPTERLVEKQKQIKAYNMERDEFIKICLEVVKNEEAKFRSLFKQIALSVDWSLEYQTISPLSRKISQMSFLDLLHKGEVYRANQPILWDTVDGTALAQADIEDKQKISSMNYITFKTEQGDQLTIATTRPELLPACVAVFYHPDDVRYKHLADKSAITPLFNEKVPILADPLVQQDKGTGLVMCCTFGDQTDITWWKSHNLPLKTIITKKGTINFPHKLDIDGLTIKEARTKIIDILKEQSLLTKQEEIIQTVKCAERSGAPLEILTVTQWFIKTITHKEALLKRTNELNWYPKNMKMRLENWINSLSWDWCISRQRYFGVPFPIWYSKRIGEEGKILYADISQLPVDPLKDLPIGYSKEEVDPDLDVMDTWATSSVSPQLSTYGISEDLAINKVRHDKLFPMDLRPQAHEIIRTWAFYTILKSHLHQNILPWKNIMVSGWCLAEDRSKMSKSKGNVLVPEKLLERYGADVIRYWSANSKLGADTAYSEDVMKNGKRLVNKLWNAAKFVSIHFDKLTSEDKKVSLFDIKEKITNEFDQWMINKLVALVKLATNALQNYEYANAIYLTEKFFWSIFCDNYLEISKTRSYDEANKNPQGQYSSILTLYHIMQTLLKLFAPFMPHITEELYQILYNKNSIHMQGNWINYGDLNYEIDVQGPEGLLEILDIVRKFKAEYNLSIKAPIKLLEVSGIVLSTELVEDLKNVTSAEEIQFKAKDDQIKVNIKLFV
ncbi:valine--tRNA ligase [Rickettsia prowazekii]|uniref:Valine--tRNA ligase n=2 Tax=Rickettsia prowazekii TaxID=782 RepID=SYV_RICPR|nr:valine--tRNA ligase [Rickettsia prowazekii]Q9ZCN6.1 RecName: Full=Valine--tRNA ligase; AltName: Full=Valyl-tRNA synthetase; Short=ValRS [Rickettsia prowazekii str. Madrid E]ADE30234.1 Valyl-tRNA synthetase [Rickettsia prowazekii str. Rp22]AFE50329.1 valyl-tRNA synthetase [Rickettsia prowazekii str. Katsinyian]AFE51175.1 valyl-tRNA synthetase [Rickettsia prowazekii str. BuV67-CWPP]AGJ01655.1 Valine--tRNA ligase [Rickettsia prowazekii str. NMRC Madrid E]AMS12564.1 valine--tRNA ligase [Ricket